MFICYVSALSSEFVKVDLFRSNMVDAEETITFELGRHVGDNGLTERNTCQCNFIQSRLD